MSLLYHLRQNSLACNETCNLLTSRYVEETALGKAKEVAGRLADRQDWAVVIGADTVVVGVSLSSG